MIRRDKLPGLTGGSIALLLLFLASLVATCSCPERMESVNGRYRATKVQDGSDAHYQVTETATGRIVLTTTAQYSTANDVKAGGFSADSTMFAAAYHYEHEGRYTWIGVWSTETGEFLYSKKQAKWTTSLGLAFDKPTAVPDSQMPSLTAALVPIVDGEFVTREGSRLMLTGDPFRFVGTNAYFLQPEIVYGNVSGVVETLDAAASLGMSVVRTWAFNDNDSLKDPAAIQAEPGVYREESLEALDHVVAEAKQRNIRLILTLVNYWPDYGGVRRYMSWCDCGATESSFYSEEEMKGWYRDYARMLVNRTNTVTGIPYRDEPAILAWELGNELRNPGGSVDDFLAWQEEMATYIKGLDPNHLVADGGEGFDDAHELYPGLSNSYAVRGDEGVSYHRLVSLPSIDMVSYHLYPNSWGLNDDSDVETWIQVHQQLAWQAGKVAYLGEYCARQNDSLRVEVYDHWLTTALIDNQNAGALLWGLVYQDRPDYDGCSVYCPSDAETCAVLRKHATYVTVDQSALNGHVTPSSPPVPPTPTPTAASVPMPAYVCSPHGDIPFGARAFSPDGTKYAREVEEKGMGNIGIFDLATDKLIRVLNVDQHPDGDFSNPLKGLAWSPDSRWLAAMFHHGSGGHISVVNVDSGTEVGHLAIERWYHCLWFSSDGTEIIADGDSLAVGSE
jgi:hypothetical protein